MDSFVNSRTIHMIDELEQYKYLISNAKAKIQFDSIVTPIGEKGTDEYDELNGYFQTTTFNGYHPLERFRAKLKSLSIVIETEHFLGDNTILAELIPLKEVFRKTPNQIEHKAFEAIANANYETSQSEFKEYISESYWSLNTLINHLQNDVLVLFKGNAGQEMRDKAFVDTMLIDFNIVDWNGESLLRARNKYRLWALMIALKEEGIIDSSLAEAKCIQIIWAYIKGHGDVPIKSSKGTGYDDSLKQFKEYISKRIILNH